MMRSSTSSTPPESRSQLPDVENPGNIVVPFTTRRLKPRFRSQDSSQIDGFVAGKTGDAGLDAVVDEGIDYASCEQCLNFGNIIFITPRRSPTLRS